MKRILLSLVSVFLFHLKAFAMGPVVVVVKDDAEVIKWRNLFKEWHLKREYERLKHITDSSFYGYSVYDGWDLDIRWMRIDNPYFEYDFKSLLETGIDRELAKKLNPSLIVFSKTVLMEKPLAVLFALTQEKCTVFVPYDSKWYTLYGVGIEILGGKGNGMFFEKVDKTNPAKMSMHLTYPVFSTLDITEYCLRLALKNYASYEKVIQNFCGMKEHDYYRQITLEALKKECKSLWKIRKKRVEFCDSPALCQPYGVHSIIFEKFNFCPSSIQFLKNFQDQMNKNFLQPALKQKRELKTPQKIEMAEFSFANEFFPCQLKEVYDVCANLLKHLSKEIKTNEEILEVFQEIGQIVSKLEAMELSFVATKKNKDYAKEEFLEYFKKLLKNFTGNQYKEDSIFQLAIKILNLNEKVLRETVESLYSFCKQFIT